MHSPVKRNALELDLNVHQPATLKDDRVRIFFEKLQPDCIIVVAYGKLLPPWLIRLPRFGVVNLHGSLLPKYRGAAPIQWAVANGETETGVCTMQIDEGLDTGPVYLCEKTFIEADETIPQLSERLGRSWQRTHDPYAFGNHFRLAACNCAGSFPGQPCPDTPKDRWSISIGAGRHRPFTTAFGL